MVPDPDMVLLADKSNMRERLRGLYGLSCFVPLIGVYRDVNDLFAAELKYPCIIKMNRGSGMNMVVHSHDELVSKRVMDTIRFWFTVEPYYYSRELHYSSMSPCLVVEDYLGDNLLDYKVYCFNGVPKFVQVDVDRFNGHKRAFYDLDWKLMDFGMLYPKPTISIHPSPVLFQMIDTASLISKPFEFMRVDYYVSGNTLLIGECTFFPEGGMGLFDNKDQDEQIGAMFMDNVPNA